MALDIKAKALLLKEFEDKAVQLGKEEMLFSERETGNYQHDSRYLRRIERLVEECRVMRNRILDTF